jgi:radical SAM superfamily enzyme YgiQ (UPF0313 family)
MKKGARQLEEYRRARLSAERGAAPPKDAPLRVCLVFPNSYHAGMSNLAVHSLYSILNSRSDCVCERSFCEEPLTGRSLESGSGLGAFHIVAFTISFELDYPNALRALDAARIPLRSAERDASHPLIIAGGPCIFSNPEPLADFLDLFAVGEGEEIIHEIIDAFASARELRLDKSSTLRALGEIPGAYAPFLYEPIYSDDGLLTGMEESGGPALPIAARVVPDLDAHPCCSAIVTPATEFARMFLVELGRGCRRGCRFCSACHTYLRRARSLESLKEQILRGKNLSDRVGLVTSDLADYPQRKELLDFLLNNGLGFSVSSVRADAITDDLLEGMAKTGQRTLTLAPEVATEKLSALTGKKITAEALLAAVDMALRHEIINFRMYFMIGLPGEDDEDVLAIAGLASDVHDAMRGAAAGLKKIGTLTVSVNPFVPKSFTPLESAAFAEPAALSRRLKMLRERLGRVGNTRLMALSPRMARLQCVFARGDRRAGGLAVALAEGRTPAQAMRMFAELVERCVGAQPEGGAARPWSVIEPPAASGKKIRKGSLS